MEETTKKEFITRFNTLYQDFCSTLTSNSDKFNADNKRKIIGAYSGIFFGYCKEIEILLSTNWYTSLVPLTRDLLECYATIKKLIFCYPNQADFDEYFKYLILIDILQDKKIFEQLETDVTITDSTGRDHELNGFLARFESLLQKYFPTEAIGINKSNLKGTIFPIINGIYNSKYRNDKNNYPAKSNFIGDMLFKNEAWKKDSGGVPYVKSYTIYSTLCHSTHNNISSVEERTVDSGYFKLNTESSHIEAVLSLAYYCGLDILEELKTILD